MTDDTDRTIGMVKFLFQRIRDGKVKFTPDVPDLVKAIDAVRFDENGEPIIDTVAPPVVMAAHMAWAADSEQAESDAAQTLAEILPERVEVTEDILATFEDEEAMLPLAIAIYREAAALVSVCAGLSFGYSPEDLKLPREQAVCAALLTKIAKYMSACAALADTHTFGEVTVALYRTILECGVNVMFFCQSEDLSAAIERFVLDGLAPEREVHDLVTQAIAARGHRLPIEDRMLEGIARRCKESRTTIDQVVGRRRDPDFKSRLRAIGLEEQYVFFQRLPSAAVHGTWLDLLHHHLTVVDDGLFRVRFESSVMDVRILAPIGIWTLWTATAYVHRFLDGMPGVARLHERLEDTAARLNKLEDAHELAVQRRRSAKA